MTTYKNIHGKRVKTFATDLDNAEAEGQIFFSTASPGREFKTVVGTAAWSSTANIPTATRGLTNTGSVDASVAYGGYTTENVATTLEYNGVGWASANDMPGNFPETSKGGTQTAVISAGGVAGPPAGAATREYDGTNWTAGGNLGTGRYVLDGDGTQTAGWVCGGNINPGSGVVSQTLTEEYNGTAWSESGDLSNARNRHSTAGLQTAGLAFGGSAGVPMTISSVSTSAEEYDGSSWTTGGTMGTGRYSVRGGGIQTNALAYGGNTPAKTANTELYDGTSWTETGNLAAAVTSHGGDGLGTTKSWLAVGGATDPGNTNLSTTQEFNITVNTVTAAAWASGGAMNTGRGTAGDCGTYLAGLVFGGNPIAAPYTDDKTEEYNGTSWSESGDLASATSDASGAGTQTAALCFARSSSPTSLTQTYDGSTWTSVPATLPSISQSRGIGTQTAALVCGYGTPTFEYDGSSWTAGGALNNNRTAQKPGGWGIQTAAVIASGYSSPPATIISNTETYNGTSWTETGHSVLTAVKRTASTSAAPSSNGLMFSGPTSAGSNTSTTITQGYNGTVWFTQPSLATARTNASGFGTATNAVAAGGHAYPGSPGTLTTTEEFTAETTSLNLKTITDS